MQRGFEATLTRGYLEGRGGGSDPELLREFVAILTKGKKDNTYKFALARFLLDYSRRQHQSVVGKAVRSNRGVEIAYDEISREFLRYYWHQECMYKIRQNSHLNKPPAIISVIRDQVGSNYIPSKFSDIDKRDMNEMIQQIRKRVFNKEKTKTSIVIPRFQNIAHGNTVKRTRSFYDYDDDRGVLTLRPEALLMLRQNYNVLIKSVFLEWAKYLEKINTMPMLIAKVNSVRPERRSLKFALKALQKDFTQCFYCNTSLDRTETDVDHFIPWSYMFDDELWNLVLACGKCNGKKSDLLAGEKYLKDLLNRNDHWSHRIRQLERSIKKIDTRRGWKKEIEMHYTNCFEYGFGVQEGLFFDGS